MDIGLLEYCIREEQNFAAERRIAVLSPIKVTVTNYPERKVEYFKLPNNPQNPDAGSRELPFTRDIYIDRSDFAEVPPPKFHRLKPGGEVRLMGAYIIKCDEVVKDSDGNIKELRCTCDFESGCNPPSDGRKVKGTIHWLSADYAENTEIRVYGRMFTLENVFDIPEDSSYMDYFNPDSVGNL